MYILDADPDLADAVGPQTATAARPYAVAAVEEVEAGPWDPHSAGDADPGDIGLLVLDGLAIRHVTVGNRTGSELLGSGDLLRPWDRPQDLRAVESDVTWTAVSRLRLARLDARFALVAGRWPSLMAAIVSRALSRSSTLAFTLALSQLTGLETRLHILLLEIAQRWGQVTAEGVRLELELTHEALAQLVGARRPSVTTALGRLEADGTLTRDGRVWLLRGEAPKLAEAPE